IRESALERFSTARMAEGYEAVYERMLRPADEGEEPVSSAPVTYEPAGERLARLRATAAVPPPQELRATTPSAIPATASTPAAAPSQRASPTTTITIPVRSALG